MYAFSRIVPFLAAITALLLTSASLGGCVTEKSVYDAAVAEGTPDALREYLELYPDGRYAPLARPDLDEARWAEAETHDTAEAYEAYLANHPDGIHSQDARTAAPAAAWKEMDFLNDRAAIDAFLAKYEYSAYATKARDRKALLDLYPSHLSIGATQLAPAESGGWAITTELGNIGTMDILEVGFRVGFEDKDGAIVAQLESFMGEQIPPGEGQDEAPPTPLQPGDARTFSFDVPPDLVPEGWIQDDQHVRLVVSTLTLAEA